MSSAEDGTVVPREETDIPPPPRRDETNDSEDVPPPPPRRETTDDASESPPPPRREDTTEQEVAPTAAATTDDSKGLAPVQDTLPPPDPSEIELATSITMSKVADVELGAEELELLMDIGDEAAENNNGDDASSTSSTSSSSDDDNVDDVDGNMKEDPITDATAADTSENKDDVEDEDSGEKKRKRDEADGNGDHDDDDVLSKKKEKKEKKGKKDKKSKKEKKDKKSKKEKKEKKSKKDKKEKKEKKEKAKKDKKAETEEGESSDPKPAKKPAAPRKPKEPPVDSVTRFQQGASTNDILADARKQLAKKNAKVRQQEREAAAVDPGRKAFKESQRQCRKQIDHQRISEDLQRSLTGATYGGVALSGGGGGGGEMSNSMPVPGILARLGSTATMGSGGSPDQSQHLPPPPLSINTGASATSGLAGPSPTSTPTTISRLAASFSNPVPMVGGFAAPSAPSSQHMAGLTSSQNMPSSGTASPRDATDLTNRFLARFTHEKSKKIQQIVNKPSSGLAAAIAGSNGKSKGSAAAAKVQNDEEEEHVELEIEVGDDESGNSPEEEQANMFPASFGQNKNTQDELKKKRVRLEIGDSQSTGDDSQHNVIDLGAIENDNEGSGDDEHTRNIRRRHEMKRLQKAYAAEASQSQSVFGASAANSQAGGGGVSSVAAAVSRHNASQSSGGGSGHHHHGHHHHGSEGSRKVFLGTTTTTPGTTSSVASAPSAAGAASAPAVANNADVVLQSLKRTSVLSRKASTAFTSVSAADATMLRRTNSFENAGGGGLMVFGSNKQGSDNNNSQTK